METQRALGFVKTEFDVRHYVDLTLLDAATKRLQGN
jgi:hypothetical protein